MCGCLLLGCRFRESEPHRLPSTAAATYYESLVTSNPVRRERAVDADGLVHAPTGPGIALPSGLDYPPALHSYVEAAA